MVTVLLAVCAVGIWAILIALVCNMLWWARQVADANPSETATPSTLHVGNGHPRVPVVEEDPAWSPEGWGRPDSEVTMSDADEFLRRRHNPLADDAE